MIHNYTLILHIIQVYHSPSVIAHRSQLQQFCPFNYLSLSPTYGTYPHILIYYMSFNYFRLLPVHYWVYLYIHTISHSWLLSTIHGSTQSYSDDLV